ncbi:hypothetical protein [Treponema sp.]|uniref:hypothetical protein n=1 Tax=Treponema sp. TaxID=166 RepID=UPI00298DEB5F|nr:hypothetical protein [Treponema sp.]MCR5613012.1 hypothetical protein [Treponema sp.]
MKIKENKIIFLGSIFILLMILISSLWNVQSAQKQTQIVADSISNFYMEELKDHSIDASIGAIVLSEGKSADFEHCYKLVDDGLYESKKKNGRSAITFAKN